MKQQRVSREERQAVARTVAMSMPVVVVLWVGIIRLALGTWSFVFPGMMGVFSLTVVVGLLCPDPVGRLTYRCWNALISGIDWLVTRVICALLYFLIITPLGMCLRIAGVAYARIARPGTANPRWVPVAKTLKRRDYYLKQY